MTCDECPKREECTKLCDRARDYVDGVVKQLPRKFVIQVRENPDDWPIPDIRRKSNERLCVEMYFRDKKPEKYIATHLSLGLHTVSNYVHKANVYLSKKLSEYISRL